MDVESGRNELPTLVLASDHQLRVALALASL
jgi:hypothetical protein